jgi:Ca2+:H+ antiporter
VKAQITGSLIGNSLLGLGLAALVGGWGKDRQTFTQERAGLLSSLLVLSVIALLVPALFDYTERSTMAVVNPELLDQHLSLGVAVILIIVYVANLVYTLVTHRDIFAFTDEAPDASTWSLRKSIAALIGATALIAVEAELVAGALEATAKTFGLSEFFLGVIVLAVVGNIAEYISAVYFARRDRMGLVMTITVGSTIQVALLTAPLLVLISYAMGRPMTLVFDNPLELIAIAAVAFSVNAIAQDGETTWFEGLLLLAVYAVLGMAFFFVTS